MDKQQVTPAEFNEVADYFAAEHKRYERVKRVGDALARIGSMANAAMEIEQRHAAAKRGLDEAEAEVASARQDAVRATAEAAAIVERAKQEAARIVEKAKADAEAERARLDAELQRKRGEIAEIDARLARIREAMQR